MTQAYIVAEVDVADPEAYSTYTAQVPACLAPFEGSFIVRAGAVTALRAGAVTALEGASPAGRIVILAFPSKAQAQAFWNSPAYRAIAPIRQGCSTARIFMVEGN